MTSSMSSAPDAPIILHRPLLNDQLLASTSSRSGRTIEELYDVQSTVRKLLLLDGMDLDTRREGGGGGGGGGGFRRVALQFPDEILPDSVPIFWALKRETRRLLQGESSSRRQTQRKQEEEEEEEETKGVDDLMPEFYILADTSYGNCCVDEVAAQHVEADVVVHYGHACLSPTARLPVLYVFPKQPIDVEHAILTLVPSLRKTLDSKEISKRKAILFSYDVAYAHVAQHVFERLRVELQQAGSSPSSSSSGGSQSTLPPPLVMTRLDTAKNFEDRIRTRKGDDDVGGKKWCRDPSLGGDDERGDCGNGGSGCCCSSTSRTGGRAAVVVEGTSRPPSAPAQPAQDAETLAGGDGSGRLYDLPSGCTLFDTIICYLGGESLALTNLLLRAGPATPVVSYDPYSPARGARREDGKTNRLLMRRYAAVQKAKDASVIGLLVGTLGVQSYLPLLAHLRQLLTGRRPGEAKSSSTTTTPPRKRGAGTRKVYTISVGKLSPAKLANFQEVDLFVLLACPENSLVDAVDPTGMRSREFYKPIVTPFEMMLALDESRTWTGEYVLDLGRLLDGEKSIEGVDDDFAKEGRQEGKKEEEGEGEEEQEGDRPHFSLITGGYVSRRRFRANDDEEEATEHAGDGDDDEASLSHTGVVVVRSPEGQVTRILESANAMHLATRTWKGLETRLGMDPPSLLEQGREGIARGYRDADGKVKGEEAR